MNHFNSTRRAFLGSAASGLVATPIAGQAQGSSLTDLDESFTYEVIRSDAEWRKMLSPKDYKILREGSTELPKSSPLWKEDTHGTYACKGCDLTVYESKWKVILDKGWVFFQHARPNTTLTDIDGFYPEGMVEVDPRFPVPLIEAHCRRCGSHLGHILKVEGKILHCINGASLNFTQTTA